MKRLNLSSIGLTVLLMMLLTATASFDPLPFQEVEALQRAKHIEPIEVLILENPLTHITGQAGSIWGIDSDRLYEFSEHTGLKIKTIVFKSAEKLVEAFNKGKGQIVISRRHLDLPDVNPGPLFEEVRHGLFCRKEIVPEQLKDMTTLRILKAEWPLNNEIKALQKNKADCFSSELNEGLFAIQPHFMIKKMGEIPTSDHHTWWVRQGHKDIQILLSSWYRKNSRAGDMTAIEHRYHITLNTLKESDIRRFYTRAAQVLPTYLPAFKEVAAQVKLPWALAAAVAYQESQWNHDAVSFTGVKGLMQLTLQTAEHMGVSDREDPFQSIWGGTRYLKHLWEEWVEVRDPKDRILLTLASYNVGIAHMYDVMEMVREKGQSPYQWRNIEAVLPSLEDESVYKNLRYGAARGTETVDFVNRTYSFYQLLSVNR